MNKFRINKAVQIYISKYVIYNHYLLHVFCFPFHYNNNYFSTVYRFEGVAWKVLFCRINQKFHHYCWLRCMISIFYKRLSFFAELEGWGGGGMISALLLNSFFVLSLSRKYDIKSSQRRPTVELIWTEKGDAFNCTTICTVNENQVNHCFVKIYCKRDLM